MRLYDIQCGRRQGVAFGCDAKPLHKAMLACDAKHNSLQTIMSDSDALLKNIADSGETTGYLPPSQLTYHHR